MSVEAMYQEIILDHYRAKHHSGLREPYGAQVTHVNPSCGDEVMLRVALDGDDTDRSWADDVDVLEGRLTVLEVRSAAFEYDDFDVRIYFDD